MESTVEEAVSLKVQIPANRHPPQLGGRAERYLPEPRRGQGTPGARTSAQDPESLAQATVVHQGVRVVGFGLVHLHSSRYG